MNASLPSGKPPTLRRDQLEHAIRAATEMVRSDSVIIGSQSILGTWSEDELPFEATMSDEVDICPLNEDDAESLATEPDAATGEMSQFHETHRFCIQGVGRRTALLPEGWTDTIACAPEWLQSVSPPCH